MPLPQPFALIVAEPPSETASWKLRPLCTLEMMPGFVQFAPSAGVAVTAQVTAGLAMPGTAAVSSWPKVWFFMASVSST